MARFDIILAVICLLKLSLAAEIEILYTPSSLQFRDSSSQQLSGSQLSRFFIQCLGFTTKKLDWDGFEGYKNIANIPQSVVVFQIPISLQSIATKKFPLKIDSDLKSQYGQLKDVMASRNNNQIFAEFVRVESIDVLEKNLESQQKATESRPTLLWFEVASDHAPQDVQATFEKLVKKLRSRLGDRVLIVSLFEDKDATLARKARDAKAQDTKDKKAPNLAYPYSVEFHSAFALIGFTTVLFVLAVFVIAVGMWNIDPGRDSIIYRLTSQKIKKDQ